MAKRKIEIVIPVTPPGFARRVVKRDPNGKPVIKKECIICKKGDVIEIDDAALLAKYGVAEGLADRYIKSGIAIPASASAKVTKVALYGELDHAKSGIEESNPLPSEADAV